MKTCVLPFKRRNGFDWRMRLGAGWNGVRTRHSSSSRAGPLSRARSTIVGCAKNVNGQLRIVGSPSDCAPSEHAVQFAAPQAPNGPAAVTVDCAAGQSVNQALADTADATQVDITIKGTC